MDADKPGWSTQDGDTFERHRFMKPMLRRLLGLAIGLAIIPWPSRAMADQPVFTHLRRFTVDELNQILDKERLDFLRHDEVNLFNSKGDLVLPAGYQLPAAARASNDVDVYTVTYDTTLPERNNQPARVSGLLALPTQAKPRRLPLMAYQHGTVYNTYAVPSNAFQTKTPSPYEHRDESWETRYMVALFAGNGYGVMAADLVAMGSDSGRNPEGYLIRDVSAQANVDLYKEVIRHLAGKGIKPTSLFLGGWSQGGINTTGFLQKLEGQGVQVRAAFTASAPNDPLAAMNAFLFHPLTSDTKYFVPLLAQTLFSCEAYGGPEGLAKDTLEPQFYAGMKSIDARSYGNPPGDLKALQRLLDGWQAVERRNFLKPQFRDPAAFATSAYGRCLSRNQAYRQEFKTDLRMYYGSIDPIIRPTIGRLAADYQRAAIATPEATAIGKIVAVPVEGGTHRLTFITGSTAEKAWMDQLR